MTLKTPIAAAGLAADCHTNPVSSDRIASPDGQPRRVMPLMRRYEVAHLTTSMDVTETSQLAPAIPVFEDCFGALGRGAILQTDSGPRAVEDLWPGDRVLTVSHGMQTLLWRGMMQIVPRSPQTRPEIGTMIRITAEAMGFSRPATDLVLGPTARIAHRAPGTQRLTGDATAFVPARDFVDQCSVVALQPITPVHAYQLGFADHVSISAGGIEVETLHPGLPHRLNLRPDLGALLMSLFPHKTALTDFGPLLHPRIALRDLDLFSAA
ncbi:Hint domain-containing protein [Loktanella sp. DJP18]|uniref:Hint domain-containing protein n=1 Tax=Loktanella sp. DJP18 TaxID=3409788 RepID=UPI003BB5476A